MHTHGYVLMHRTDEPALALGEGKAAAATAQEEHEDERLDCCPFGGVAFSPPHPLLRRDC